jgi:predicted RNase H-like HicB family nuclease
MGAYRDWRTAMRYTVVIEPTNESDQPGWYYAHVPAFDLTTHGKGVEGAMAAAKELVEVWIADMRSQGKSLPENAPGFVSHIEVA